MMEFSDMNIDPKILKALNEMGLKTATEIQEKTIPVAMQGKDLTAQSMTGSGKTAAFTVPILHKVQHGSGVQALILAPTRELALQIAEHQQKISKHGRLSICTVYGGVGIEPQIAALRHADVVVGTPGRVLDHMERRTINFSKLKILVLDEADRMLDMGFIDDIKIIIAKLPTERQTMLFSATLPDEIRNIAHRFMKHPVSIKAAVTVSKHKLAQFYYDVRDDEKLSALVHLINKEKPSLAIVFCATRDRADMVADALQQHGAEAKPIHGGMSQGARTTIMEGFHRGRPHILVATDVAARGLDIKNVSHIFNFDLPQDFDAYTHRIGRTARIGKEGKALSLLSYKDHDVFRKILQHHEIKRIKEDFPKLEFRMRERRGGGGGGRGGGRRRPRWGLREERH